MILASLLAIVPASLSGEVLIGWDFSPLDDGNGGGTVLSSTQLSSALEEEPLTKGSGINNATGNYGFGANAWNGTITGLAQAVNANEFVTFGIRPKPGSAMSVSSIASFNVRRSASGPTTGQIQFLVEMGESPEWVNIGSAVTWGSDTTEDGNQQAAIDLTTYSELQNISGGTTVLFRIVCWGASSGSGTWYLNDPESDPDLDFVIEGSTTSGLDYATWISDYEVEGQDGFTADFDKDGLSNGLESFLGSNPTLPSRGILSVSGTSNSVTLQHERAETVPSDVGVTYEWSPDLVQWFSSGLGAGLAVSVSDPELILDGTPNDLMEVTATLTSGQASALFLRIKAERP
jgi:hypothetical protein